MFVVLQQEQEDQAVRIFKYAGQGGVDCVGIEGVVGTLAKLNSVSSDDTHGT